MYQRVAIFRGLLLLNGLDYTLTSEEPPYAVATGTYRGDAWVADGRVVIGAEHADRVPQCYRIGAATQASIDHRDGEAHAAAQRRCCWPNGKSAEFVASWIDAWEARRKGSTRGFITDATGHVVRESSMKRAARARYNAA